MSELVFFGVLTASIVVIYVLVFDLLRRIEGLERRFDALLENNDD